MLPFPIGPPGGLRQVLCIGAHCDDIEIGCGGTLLTLLAAVPDLRVTWVVMSASAAREREARASAAEFLGGGRHEIIIEHFRDGYFPTLAGPIKDCMEALRPTLSPDLVLTHQRSDLHQDHRLLGELTWNTFRNHSILEYEIPKYDGDLGRPNVFMPLTEDIRARKVRAILRHYASQADKRWFSESTFNALMRLRGIECNAPDGYAEAFYGAKLVLGPPPTP